MKRNVFIRLLFHLTVIMVVITLLVGTLVYRNTNSMLQEEALASNTELLAQSRKIVEQALGEVKLKAGSLALNTDVQKAVWLPWNLEEESRFLQRTGELFPDRINSSNYIRSIYLYSAINDKLISGSGITDAADFEYAGQLQKFLANRMTSQWDGRSRTRNRPIRSSPPVCRAHPERSEEGRAANQPEGRRAVTMPSSIRTTESSGTWLF